MFTTPYTYALHVEQGFVEFNDEPSMTVPDQSYTIRDLIDRFTRGIAPPVGQDGLYSEEDELEDFYVDPWRHITDLSDITEMEMDLAARKAELIRAQEQKASDAKPTGATAAKPAELTEPIVGDAE